MEIKSEIKTKLLSEYIGNKISLDQSRFSEEEKDTSFTLSGVGLNAFQVKETRLWYNFETMYDGALIDKLILKPMTKLHIDDAYKVAMILGEFRGDSFSVETICKTIIEIIAGTNSLVEDVKHLKFLMACQYLQSKGYDLPHYLLDGKNLKEAGLAIYEKN